MKSKKCFEATKLLTVALVLMLGMALNASVAMAQPLSHPYSQNVALVPNASGLYDHGGTLPTSGFGNLPDGITPFTPTFTNLHPNNIRDDATDPIVAGGYDTVVLNAIEDSPNLGAYLNNATFLARIDSFVVNGGKLIIYTSETATNPYWNNFMYPFQTTNPGDAGWVGTPFNITEENTLSSSDPTSYYYIDTDAVTNQTDAVGDANVFITYDPNWCQDMEGQNMLGTIGPVHAYVHYGAGLIIYNALDIDWLGWGTNTGTQYLAKIWRLELMQPWNPSGLPCQPIAPGLLTLEPRSDSNPTGTNHELTATLVDDQGASVPGVTVTFTVTGDNPTSGTAPTDVNGEAKWGYTGTNAGLDKIVATCTCPATGQPLTSNDAWKTWTPGNGPGPQVPGMTGWGIMAAAIMLAALIPLALRRRGLVSRGR